MSTEAARTVQLVTLEKYKKMNVKVKNPSLSLLFSSLVCIHPGHLRTDISGIDQPSLFHLILISLSFTLISFIPFFLLEPLNK